MIRVLNTIPTELDKTFSMNVCAPSFRELNELALIDGVSLRCVTVFDEDGIQACLPCCIEERRHHGIVVRIYSSFSGKLHDYQRMFCSSQEAGRELVLGIIKDAKANHCDVISIDSIIPPSHIPACFKLQCEIKIFSASEEKRGWQELYVRKSVRRFENMLKRVGNLHVEITDGKVDDNLMKELRDLHVIRWKFSGSSSAFESKPNRIAQYTCNPENKHYMRVMLDNEIVSCHYGMRYGNTLLWHTPLINPKYMRYSPLRILLANEAKYCEKNGFECIDFGLGDEGYKNGYCHQVRETIEFQKSLTAKGGLTTFVGYIANHRFKDLQSKLVGIARDCKNYVKQKRVHWLYFIAPSNSEEYTDPLFVQATDWKDMYDLARKNNFEIREWHYLRFKKDATCRFVALANEEGIVTYGWVSDDNRDLLEGMELEGSILYDFHTPPQFQNKGYYTRLLRHLRSMYGGVIYADKRNIPSLKAIKKAGFIPA